jgi:hypothetical protein
MPFKLTVLHPSVTPFPNLQLHPPESNKFSDSSQDLVTV